MKTLRRLVTGLLSFALVLTGASVATAADNLNGSAPLNEAQVREAADIARGVLSDTPEGASVDLTKLNVARPAGTELVIVGTKLTGPGFGEGSATAAIVDLDTKSVVQSVKLKATWIDSTTADVTKWVDGKIVFDSLVSTGDYQGPQSSLASGSSTMAINEDQVLKCLRGFGITAGAAVMIVATCSSLCVVTVGLGCIACVAIFVAVGAGGAAQCFSVK